MSQHIGDTTCNHDADAVLIVPCYTKVYVFKRCSIREKCEKRAAYARTKWRIVCGENWWIVKWDSGATILISWRGYVDACTRNDCRFVSSRIHPSMWEYTLLCRLHCVRIRTCINGGICCSCPHVRTGCRMCRQVTTYSSNTIDCMHSLCMLHCVASVTLCYIV